MTGTWYCRVPLCDRRGEIVIEGDNSRSHLCYRTATLVGVGDSPEEELSRTIKVG